jgi:hypothetical protein
MELNNLIVGKDDTTDPDYAGWQKFLRSDRKHLNNLQDTTLEEFKEVRRILHEAYVNVFGPDYESTVAATTPNVANN